MTVARRDIYDKHDEGIYHCHSRCVRRAYLCGQDEYTGKNYDHRKQWVVELLEVAAGSYVIDILSFSVMDNHFHVLLRNRPDLRHKLTPTGIARRWLLLHPKRRDRNGKPCEPTVKELREITSDKQRVKELRNRLGDISWLMGYVKERLARWSNQEDEVTGTFFEKRYQMQRLLSDSAALGCSIYIDLNPIRAGMAQKPEDSEHTSAMLRILALKARLAGRQGKAAMTDRWLAPIHDQAVPQNQRFAARGWRASDAPGLSLTLSQYLQLLDWSGRQVKHDKRGKIPAELAPILVRLGIEQTRWVDLITRFGELFRRIAGSEADVRQHAQSRGRRWFHGISTCRNIFTSRDE